jgi:hypothetical protein
MDVITPNRIVGCTGKYSEGYVEEVEPQKFSLASAWWGNAPHPIFLVEFCHPKARS